MAYTKQTWADLPSKTTPINATRLGHIEQGIYDAAATADTAASTAGTAAANIGIVSGRVDTLTGRVNGLDTAVSNKVDKVAGKGLSTNDYDDTDKAKVNSLGTSAYKNSTSVVTESSDLVESGAVYTALQSKADNSVIGTVENGTTASQAYAVGSHAIRNGAFITWKNAKAQGETINDASDYTSGDVAGCLIKQATFSGEIDEYNNLAITSNANIVVLQAIVENTTEIPILWVHPTTHRTIINCKLNSQGVTLSGKYYYIDK